MDILRGLLGIFFLIFISYLLSSAKKQIDWKLVISGIVLQFLFAIAVLKFEHLRFVFENISSVFVKVLDFTEAGSRFVFGDKLLSQKEMGFIFAFQVLPTVIFFSALSS